MSAKANFLSHALNNHSVRGSLRIFDWTLVEKRVQEQVLICEGSDIAVKVFDFCSVCASVYTAFKQASVSGVVVTGKFVDKGTYILGFCGKTHFVAYRKFDKLDGEGFDQFVGRVSKVGLDSGTDGCVTGVDVGAGALVKSAGGRSYNNGVCRGVSSSGSSSRDTIGSGKSQVSFSVVERSSIDSCTSNSGDSVAVPLVACNKGSGSTVGSKIPVVRKVRAALFNFRRDKRAREAEVRGLVVGDNSCRYCRHKTNRCESCQAIVDADVAEARLRTVKANVECVQISEGKAFDVAISGATVEENKQLSEQIGKQNPKKIGEAMLQSVKDGMYKISSFEHNKGVSQKDTYAIDGSLNFNPKKLDKEAFRKESEEIMRIRSFIRTLAPARRLALFSIKDKEALVEHDPGIIVSGVAKLRKSDRLDALASVSDEDLKSALGHQDSKSYYDTW